MTTTTTLLAESPQDTTITCPTLLVVDSEPGLRTFLTKFFTPRGYRVLTTASHEEAVHLLREETITCLLVELRHEVEDLALLRHLRTLDPAGRVRTVFSAAYVDQRVDREARRLGLNDYIPRPWDVWDLEATVTRVIATPDHRPRWMDARSDAERYIIWLREPQSGGFRMAHASSAASARIIVMLSSDDPSIQWLARHPEPGVLTQRHSVASSHLQAWDLEYMVGLYQHGQLIGVVGLKDRIWHAWYEAAEGSMGFTISPQRLWVAEVQAFAAERLEDNQADLLMKLATILADPVHDHALALRAQTLPAVYTFADGPSLTSLQAEVHTALAYYHAHGYLYAAGGEGPWPIALIATWDAYRTLLEEHSAPAEALSALEALSGLFLAPSAVEQFVRTVRRFPALVPIVH